MYLNIFSFKAYNAPKEEYDMISKQNNCGELPLVALLRSKPRAAAVINGSEVYPDISGLVRFYQTQNGVIVYAEVTGLPNSNKQCKNGIFGFHIHGGTSCTGNEEDPFSDAMTHYSVNNCGHPAHNGDLPPLFGNNGTALSVFLTNRFNIDNVLGKTVIIHDGPDDFTSQPAGNSGKKIACGIIRSVTRN